MVIFIEDGFVKTCEKGKVIWNGLTEAFTRVNGREDFPTVKVSEDIYSQACFCPEDQNLGPDFSKTMFWLANKKCLKTHQR